MFVTEPDGALTEKTHVRLKVTNMHGSCVVLNVPVDFSVDKLKVEIANYLGRESSTESDPLKISLYHKLIVAESGKVLNEESSLIEEGIQDEDEILFIKKRVPVATPEHHKQEEEKKCKPTSETISKATSSLQEVNADRKIVSPFSSNDFQRELRKILITLIDAAHKLLCMDPEMSNLFVVSGPRNSEEEKSPSDSVPEDAIQQILNMGFPRDRAVKALKLNHNDASLAIQWLLEHEDDPTIDEPLPDEEVPTSEQSTDEQQSNDQMVNTLTEIRGPHRARQVIEAFRAYRQKEFKPNSKAIKMMTEMGFGEKEVTNALRIHGNRQQDALEWLLSGGAAAEEEEDFDTGLDPDSDVYKAIMSNPVVQLTLSNSKSLLAFSHMLDNPANTQQWLNDPDTGAMLIQISRIYHAERHRENQRQQQRAEEDIDISTVQPRNS